MIVIVCTQLSFASMFSFDMYLVTFHKFNCIIPLFSFYSTRPWRSSAVAQEEVRNGRCVQISVGKAGLEGGERLVGYF